jgi:D-2-hydroxyacid dehydrogenase (NADP+)
MARSILVIDPDADFFRSRLAAAFPALEVHTAAAPAAVKQDVSGIEALCGMPRAFSADIVGRASRLKWIQAFTTGTDHITRLPSLKKDTVITSMRGIHGPQMAEMAVMLMMALARDLPRMIRNQEKQVWNRFLQRRLFGKTVAILGIGISGEDLGPRCKALGMTVIGVSGTPRAVAGFDRVVPRTELLRAVAEADFLVVLVPYDKSTDKIVNADVFNAMKPGAYLVNIARGGICDEDALVTALREKRIAGAALDVFRSEPLSPESPLWKMENVIVTPHHAGQCDVYNDLVFEVLQKNVKCFIEGRWSEMVNLVPH